MDEIYRNSLAIVKYNPDFRDENGYYIRNEWTSVSDINKEFEDGVLTKEEYITVEEKYIESVFILIKSLEVSEVKISGLYKSWTRKRFKNWKQLSLYKMYDFVFEGMIIKSDNMPIISKLIKLGLRELLTIDLILKDKGTITFGYDFYMYFKTNEDEPSLEKSIDEIKKLKLYPYCNDMSDVISE